STIAGPEPPMRTYWVPSVTGICSARNDVGQAFTSARAGGAVSRLTADTSVIAPRIQSEFANDGSMEVLLGDGRRQAATLGRWKRRSISASAFATTAGRAPGASATPWAWMKVTS